MLIKRIRRLKFFDILRYYLLQEYNMPRDLRKLVKDIPSDSEFIFWKDMQKRINQISSTISVLQKPEMKFINSSSRYSIITIKVKSAIQQLHQQKPLQWFTTKLPDLPKELCSWEEWQLPAQKSTKTEGIE